MTLQEISHLQHHRFLLLLDMWHHQRFPLPLSLSALLALCFSTDIVFAQRTGASQRNLRSGIEGQISVTKLVAINTVNWHSEYVFQRLRTGLTLRIYSTSGRFIKSITSQAGGHFRADLNPGSYRIVPETPPSYPRVDPVTVNVTPRQFASVQFVDPARLWPFMPWFMVGNGGFSSTVIFLDET